MSSSVLNLCACIEGHADQRRLLAAACADFTEWDDLLQHAEAQGMGPLLYRHLSSLDVALPTTFLRGLRFLRVRHQQANTLLMQCLHDLLELLDREGIPCLVVKGAALCNTLYPEIGLRPMRDIDLLFAAEDVCHAHAFLQKNGFFDSKEAMPEYHYHLTPLYRPVGGMNVSVELHHALFPNCPPHCQPLPPFAEMYQAATPFDLDGVTGHTLATEEMLWHLYQHGFHAPLTYKPYKLISAADVISLVEKKVEEIDWSKIKSIYPQLYNALPCFHYLIPWADKALEKIPCIDRTVPSGVGERFKGWPRFRLSEQKETGILEIMRHTFFPVQWWLMIYYAPKGRLAYLWCKFVRHPKHVLWWVKLYGSIFIKTNLPYEDNAERKGLLLPVVKHIKQLSVAMYRKFN